jgi:hypothetical protein
MLSNLIKKAAVGSDQNIDFAFFIELGGATAFLCSPRQGTTRKRQPPHKRQVPALRFGDYLARRLRIY